MAEERVAQPAAAPAARPELSSAWCVGLPLGLAALLLGLGRGAPGLYEAWLAPERGVLEIGQFALLVAALGVGLAALALPRVRADRGLTAWLGLACLGCLYAAGEEVSWGQHLAEWPTPATWQALNDQNETNLHNTSVWLDQHPRSVLELGVVVGGIALPLARRLRPGWIRGRYAVLIPPLALLPTALLAELARLPERLSDALERSLHVFYRASEVQEVYFYLFVLLYLVVLRRRLAGPDATPGES